MSLILGGIQSFTTIDYPGKMAAVFFCRGCPLRCPYCQNPSLQPISDVGFVGWDDARAFLKSRRNLLDAVVFSGGEPLVQKDLIPAVKEVREYGFLTGLHTSGANAEKLKGVLPFIDWVGFDVKAPFDAYDARIPRSSGKTVEKSLETLLDSGVAFEARTTLDPRVVSPGEILPLARCLAKKGVKHYAVQEYHSFPEEKNPPSKAETTAYFTTDALAGVADLFETFTVRRS